MTPAAVVLHMESGSCPSGVNRSKIDQFMVEHDLQNVITNPSRLIIGPDGTRQMQSDTYIASAQAWNGRGYECYFCHKVFDKLVHLNQHLASPKHTKPLQKLYRCPNLACQTETVTLSAICQHIESGGCGVNRFKKVNHAMEAFVTGMNRLRL
ncbi:hypothetical protein CALVIDRAFT_539439 [Calocera viscosa TUFC12733]|uniref:C2H2-type domain-containing protein n=1 Tax=Calocera viscosa (strain TUFC12733) TaxID=1330018 RepID=A0A167JYC3_CALVF|nr:hypothetical protein CALVIDRAFT_539439 [Calocera viscosa TUFC12733]